MGPCTQRLCLIVKIIHAPIGPATGWGLQTEPQVFRGSNLCSWRDEAIGGRKMGRPLFCSWEFVFLMGKTEHVFNNQSTYTTSSLSMVLVSSASSGTLSEI